MQLLQKTGGGVSNFPAGLPLSWHLVQVAFRPIPIPTPIPFPFILLQHSPTQRHPHNSFLLNQLRRLSIATEGVPHRGILVIATQSNRSKRVQRSLPYIVTSLLPYLSARIARLLLHCSSHGTPTPRPALPGKRPMARRDRTRHSRFAPLHRAAPGDEHRLRVPAGSGRAFYASPDSWGRSTLLDRNWFGPW